MTFPFAGGGTGETARSFLLFLAPVSSTPTESSRTARATMLGHFSRRLPSYDTMTVSEAAGRLLAAG